MKHEVIYNTSFFSSCQNVAIYTVIVLLVNDNCDYQHFLGIAQTLHSLFHFIITTAWVQLLNLYRWRNRSLGM